MSSSKYLDVELFVDCSARPSSASGHCYTVALIPVAAKDGAAGPRIDSWSDVAAVMQSIGGAVRCVALGLVGVDAVNRGYSRSTGDAVLREVANRLANAAGSDGHAARIAGNQFVALAPERADLDAATLLALVSQPTVTRLGTVRIGCYAGSVVGDAASGLVVLDRADSAMRRAQARGIGAIEHLGDHASVGSGRPRLSSLLIDAVARREITVTFQPVIELATGRIIEFEALARWTSSELGEVEPALFIEAAEQSGLIHELGQIVLERSLDMVQAERLAGRWSDGRVSMNLSAAQLGHPDLPSRVLGALSRRSLPGHVLQLELTETQPVLEIASAARRMAGLREHGVRIAIDDFGTGCANMSYLRDLPLDLIKIDGRFVAGMCSSSADTAVIRSVLRLAKELRLDVVAEGVETAEQHVSLTRLGCVGAQGFLYSGDRDAADLYRPVDVPRRSWTGGAPIPADEDLRVVALRRADVLDTPAEEVYDEIVRAAADLCGTPISLVSLVDADRQWFKAKVGLDADQTSRDVAFCAHAICSEGLMEVPDACEDDRFSANPFVLGEAHVRFYAGVPLRAAAGYSYGTLCVIDTVPRVLTDEQRDGLQRLARQVTVLLELRESVNRLSDAYGDLEFAHRERDAVEETLRRQAYSDALTGLPNRALLMERIDAALAHGAATGQSFALLICDLDDFKLINDGLGHPAGDQVLVEVARRLRTCVRPTDTVARFGGDEFVVLIDNANNEAISALASRILADVNQPISLEGREIRPSISIGIASQTHGIGANELLSNADAAMYGAKACGGGRMYHFDAALRAGVLDRLTIPADFRAGLVNNELFCLHQPQVDLVSGHLFGLESLVRWNHPTRGLLQPDVFVPSLEATNGSGILFERVLRLTLEAQARWAANTGCWPSVGVNLSARQLDDDNLVWTVRSALAQFSAPASSLWLEVTETALASTPSYDILTDLRMLGVRLAIDDFGVGWSSMARLAAFPWDMLKIDRSFITPLGQADSAQHVVRGIISLAHSLGLRTSAEGVETAEQLYRLRDLGCDIAQGYLIDRPLHVDDVAQRLIPLMHAGAVEDSIGWDSSAVALIQAARNASSSAS